MNDVNKKSLFSWLLFDLANTVYAFIIPGLYFSVWLVSEKGWTDQQVSDKFDSKEYKRFRANIILTEKLC